MTVSEERHQLLACIAPHAGYVYSGGVAGELYGHLELPRRVVVLGPNHTGVGARVAVAPHERWRSPLGEQAVDVEFARLLVERYPDATFDENAHWREHSLEVQIPFLLARRSDVEFLPICLSHLGLDQCLDLGRALARLIEDLGEEVGLVASSDMSHYVEEEGPESSIGWRSTPPSNETRNLSIRPSTARESRCAAWFRPRL